MTIHRVPDQGHVQTRDQTRDQSHAQGPGADPSLSAVLPGIVGESGRFGHRQHIHLAYHATRTYGMPEAIDRMCGWIRTIAEYERAPQKYHRTVSQAWMRLVGHHAAQVPADCDFDAFVAAFPQLLDKRLLSRHYRSSTLASAAARSGWVEPDLAPFPGTGEG